MKTINLETCNRQTLVNLGIKFEDKEVRRMSASPLKDNWTEHHAVIDDATLPKGSIILKSGAFYGSGCVAVKDGRVVDRAFRGACPWWDDSIHEVLCMPEEGETLHEFVATMDSFSFCYEDDDMGLYRQAGDWGFGSNLCFNCHLFRSGWLRSIGATKDANDVASIEVAAEKAAKKAHYEELRERAEILYPYQGARVFKAHIKWALEEGVAKAALALAPYVTAISPNLRPLGGWTCHKKRISWAWHHTYGWNNEPSLDALMDVLSKLSQPRLDAAWRIAQIIK